MNFKTPHSLLSGTVPVQFEQIEIEVAGHRTHTNKLHASTISYGLLGTIMVPSGCERYRYGIAATGLPYVSTSLQRALILLNPKSQ